MSHSNSIGDSGDSPGSINFRRDLAVRASRICIWSWDFKTNEVVVSPEWLKHIGHDCNDMDWSLESWKERLHPDDRARLGELLKKYKANPWSNYEERFRLRHADGSYRWFLSVAEVERDEHGVPCKMHGGMIDITSLNTNDTLTAKNAERLALVLRATNDGIWDCDLVNNTVCWNETYNRLYGRRPDETQNSWEWWVNRIHPEDRERVSNSLIRATKSSPDYGDRWHEEYRFTKADGHLAYVVDRAYIARNEKGQPTRILGAMQDVTSERISAEQLSEANEKLERLVNKRTSELSSTNDKLQSALTELKESEQKVIRQERLGAIGEMAGGICHNLNNMLFPALALTDHLLMDKTISPEQKKLLELIQTGTSDAAELVSRLGAYHKNESFDLESRVPVDLKELLIELRLLTMPKWKTEPQAGGRNIDMLLELADVPIINSNPSDLRQVFSNLVFNSVDALPSGGTIKVNLEQVGNEVVVVFSDNGVGMTETVRNKCFEPFFSTKGSSLGTGLGLYTCATAVTRNSGTIEVESKLGVGSTFRIKLPIDSKKNYDQRTQSLNDISSLRILLIDDEESVRSSISMLLESAGHQVDVAENAEAGVAAFFHGKYDVVICDYTMPDMTGRRVASIVKERDPDVYFILITGWPLTQLETLPDALAEDFVLEKPFTIHSLTNALYKCIG